MNASAATKQSSLPTLTLMSMPLSDSLTVGVFTGGGDTTNEALLNEVICLGEKLIHRGHSIVFGGSRCGQMGALVNSAMNAREHQGGKSAWPSRIWGLTLNHWEGFTYQRCDNVRVYKDLHARFHAYQMYCDCFVSIGGGMGTYAETFFFLEALRSSCIRKPLFVVEREQTSYVHELQAPSDATMVLPDALQSLLMHRYISGDMSYVDHEWFKNQVLVTTAEHAIINAEAACKDFSQYFDQPRKLYFDVENQDT